MSRHVSMLATAAVVLAAASPAFAADAAKQFQLQCKTCHGAKSTAMGPSLAGVAGREVAGLADFKYSAGLKAKGGTWTDAALETAGRRSWVRFTLPWHASSGPVSIKARAYDERGLVQPAQAEWNVKGYIMNGIHEVNVTVTS